MPEKSSKPSYLQRCVSDLVADGKDLGSAFAICTSTMQKAGYLTKGPDMEQTKKGANRARHFSNMKDMPTKAAAYEKAVKAGRKEESNMPDNSSKVTLPEMYQVLRDIDALLPDDLDSKAYGMLAERCRKIEVPDEGFEDARHECQKALRAARSDIRKELEVIAKFREYTEKRIADAGNSAVSDFDARMARFQSSKRKDESHLSHLAAQLIANSGGGLAESSKRGCGCGGGLSEASVSKMNRKAKKAGGKSAKPTKKIKARPAPLSVPLTKGGAGVQSMLQGRQKLIKAVEADAEGIKYASVNIYDVKDLDQSDILNGNIGVYLVLDASPPSAYEDVGGEVEIEVWCGGSGEDNFETSVDYEDDFANGSIRMDFVASLGKNGKPEYRLLDGEYNESDYFRDGVYFERIIKSVTGKVLTVADLDGLIDDELPSADSILDYFGEYAQESDRFQDRYQDDCASTRGNYRY